MEGISIVFIKTSLEAMMKIEFLDSTSNSKSVSEDITIDLNHGGSKKHHTFYFLFFIQNCLGCLLIKSTISSTSMTHGFYTSTKKPITVIEAMNRKDTWKY